MRRSLMDEKQYYKKNDPNKVLKEKMKKALFEMPNWKPGKINNELVN